MKKRKKIILSLLLSLSLIVGLGGGFPLGRQVKAETQGSSFQNLNQQEIVAAMGAGWNLGNQLEANLNGTPKEDGWTNVMVTEQLIRNVKTNGFQSIRIPVSYLSMIGEAPDYTIDEAWLDRVQEIVDWAIKYKLYVIINVHGDGYSTVKGGWILPGAKDQEAIQTKFEAIWKQIAERFKDYNEYLIYESMNEVGADFSLEQDVIDATKNINTYNQIFVDTVRKSGGNNDKRWLLIPGCNTNIDYTTNSKYGFEIPTDNYRSDTISAEEKRIMVSVHYYTPWEFCGQEDYKQTQWGSDASPSKSVGYGGEEEMEKQFQTLKNTFTDKGYPVIIGEYGAIDKSKKEDSGLGKAGDADPDNTEFRAWFARKLCELSIKNGCIPMYWDNGWNGDFGFAIFSRGTEKDKELGYRTVGKVTQPEILKAIVSCYNNNKGKATEISLDKTLIQMDLSDESQQLNASLTPADAGDTITWASTDEEVASVNYKGKVTPKGIGTCLVTATVPNGPAAYCIIQVTQPKKFKAGLYAGNSSDWNTLECDDYLTVSENGSGSYTISLSGTKAQMSMLNTLFIKDVTVQRGVAKESVLKSADFVVNSLKLNNNDCTLTQNTFSFNKSGDSKVLDLCMLNFWYETANCIGDLTKDTKEQSYSLPEAYYVDGLNTLTMNVEVNNAVLDTSGNSSETKISTLDFTKTEFSLPPNYSSKLSTTATPANATEKILYFSENSKIASVAQDGTVTGLGEGETVIHALTASGLNAVCQVKVSNDAPIPTAPSEEPSSSPSPGKDPTSPTPTPGGNSSGNNTNQPGNNSSNNTPGSNQTGNHSSGGNNSNGNKTGIDKKVTVKKATIKKVKSKKKKTALVQWKKIAGVSGYQIQLGRNKKFTKSKKTITVKKAKTTKKTIKKLKQKKKYYVRVRAYKKVSGKKYYGKWSKVKTVKIK